MNCMRISGYDQKYRIEMLNGILKLKKENEIKIEKGERYRYRTGAQIKEQKKSKSGGYVDTWYLKEGYTNTLLVQSTIDSELKKLMFKNIGSRIGPDGGRVKIIEKAGKSIMGGLRKSDPYYNGECPYKIKCCAMDGVDCTKSGGVYEIECLMCDDTNRPMDTNIN